MLILYDTAHAKLCALTNYSDLYTEEVVSGTGSSDNITLPQLHFKYPLEDPQNGKIIPECYIALATDDGRDDAEYIIKEHNLKTEENGGITWVEYVCDLNVEPLKGTLIDNFAPGSVLPDQAVNLALTGTGWKVGYCDVTRRRTAAKIRCTVYEAIEDVAKAYSCEITFDSINRLVNIHQKQGADRGVYFAEQLNLKSLEIQANSRSYITRLRPIGKDGLTISGVNGGVPYVSNYQYSTKIIEAYWQDNRYTNAADLLADAQERIDYLSKPTSAYAGKIIDLSRVSGKWDPLDFRIGDWITLVSESTGVREQQRIVKIDRYPDEPEKSTCEIANRLASLDDIILRVSDAADMIDDATDSTGMVQGSAVQITNPDGTYSNLNATAANIGTLIATKANITDLTAANGRIDSLVSTKADITYLQANYLTADSIKATYATITNVQATYATINSLSAATARIGKLESSQITADYLKTHCADIDLGNIAAGTIKTAMIGNGAINTAQIADSSITDAKIVTLTANKLTAGTIDASKITVTNLDCANLTVGTINGQQIAAGAVDPTKLTSALNSTINTAAGNASSALSAAGAAQTTANGKNTAYYQTAAPSGGTYKVNDMWYDTDDGYRMYYWSGSSWAPAPLGNDAIAALDAGKITTGYLSAARIAAGEITGTMIAGNTITAANIAATTITAGQIASGAITATQIAARTITADRIISGAITANEIAAHTITANQLAVGTITAASGIISSIDAGTITTGTLSADRIDTTNLKVQKIYNATGSDYGMIGSFDFTDITDIRGTRSYSGLEFYGGDGYSGGIYSQKDAGAGSTWESIIVSPVRNNYANLYASVRESTDGSGATVSRGTASMYTGDSSDSSNWASVTATCDVPDSPRIELKLSHDAGNMSAINYLRLNNDGIFANCPVLSFGVTTPLDFTSWLYGSSQAAEGYGGSFTNPYATRIGNLTFLTGLVEILKNLSAGSTIAYVPYNQHPSYQQIIHVFCSDGVVRRLDICSDGRIVNDTYLSSGMWLNLNDSHYLIGY